MPIGLIVLIAIAAVSVIADAIIVARRNKSVADVALDMSWGWKLRKNRLVINRDHLCVALLSVLIGVAHLVIGARFEWIRYVGLGVAAVACLYNLYRLVAFYAHTYGRMKARAKHTFFEYLRKDIAGLKFSLYAVAMLCVALVWLLLY